MNKIFTLLFNVNTYRPESKSNNFQSLSNDEQFEAPDHCVENIMNFARSYNVEESKATGKIEMILN